MRKFRVKENIKIFISKSENFGIWKRGINFCRSGSNFGSIIFIRASMTFLLTKREIIQFIFAMSVSAPATLLIPPARVCALQEKIFPSSRYRSFSGIEMKISRMKWIRDVLWNLLISSRFAPEPLPPTHKIGARGIEGVVTKPEVFSKWDCRGAAILRNIWMQVKRCWVDYFKPSPTSGAEYILYSSHIFRNLKGAFLGTELCITDPPFWVNKILTTSFSHFILTFDNFLKDEEEILKFLDLLWRFLGRFSKNLEAILI